MTNSLSAYAMGALLAYYESVAVFQGFIWGINSFDQEGVQLGKLIANNIVEEYKGRHKNGRFSDNKELEVEIAFMEEMDDLEKKSSSDNNLRSA